MISQGVRKNALEFFSTDSVAAGARVSYWNELTCNTFTGVAVDPVRRHQFAASLLRTHVETFGFAQVWSAPSIVRHTEAHVCRSHVDPYYLLHLQLEGTSLNSQGGRDAQLRPGDFTICDTARPYTVAFDHVAKFLIVRLPRMNLLSRLRNVSDLVGIRVPASDGTPRMTSFFLQKVFDETVSPDSRRWLDDIGDVAIDLLALSYRHSIAPAEGIDTRSARWHTVLRFVDSRLADPTLGVKTIADEFAVTSRSVQKLFAAHGVTPGAYVLQKRLASAATALATGRDVSVTSVALDSGFSDLTHFGRVFRKSFGMSPRDYKRMNRNSRS